MQKIFVDGFENVDGRVIFITFLAKYGNIYI